MGESQGCSAFGRTGSGSRNCGFELDIAEAELGFARLASTLKLSVGPIKTKLTFSLTGLTLVLTTHSKIFKRFILKITIQIHT